MAAPKSPYDLYGYDPYADDRMYGRRLRCGAPYPRTQSEAMSLIEELDRRLTSQGGYPSELRVSCVLDDGKPKPRPYCADYSSATEEQQLLLANQG